MAFLLRSCCAALALLGSSALRAQHSAAPGDMDEIVVSGRRGSAPALLDAAGYWQKYCFEASRLSGAPQAPSEDPDWEPLADADRAKFGITDPAVPAHGLRDEARDTTLLLKIETTPGPRKLVERKCILVVLGGDRHDDLRDAVSSIFGGPAARGNRNLPDLGEVREGWDWWIWTGIPGRRSKAWRASSGQKGRGSGSGIVLVARLSFYDDHNYVYADLRTNRDGPRPISVLTLALRGRPLQPGR